MNDSIVKSGISIVVKTEKGEIEMYALRKIKDIKDYNDVNNKTVNIKEYYYIVDYSVYLYNSIKRGDEIIKSEGIDLDKHQRIEDIRDDYDVIDGIKTLVQLKCSVAIPHGKDRSVYKR